MIGDWDTAALITMKQAAEALKIERPRAARWLRRYLLKREQFTGRTIMVRTSGDGKGVRYAVTLATLYRDCPELSVPSHRAEVNVRSALRRVQVEVREVTETVTQLSAQIEVLTEAIVALRADSTA